jgi:hypothetical protein
MEIFRMKTTAHYLTGKSIGARLAVTAGLLVSAMTASHADSSIGIDPYAEGFGFDRPNEAAWGGWTRCAPGTLFAEWDNFVDDSHGAADDRTAAPNTANEGAPSCGATSAWLGWSTNAVNPVFAYNKGVYIYNLSNRGQGGPTAFRVDLAGNLNPGLTRVAMQLETRSYAIPEETLRLNGIKPTVVGNKFEVETNINGRPAKVFHQLVVWNLNSAPEGLLIEFESKAHTVLHMVTVDAGPLGGGQSGTGELSPTAKIYLNLANEGLDAAWVQSLNGQAPKFFPAEWKPRELLYKKNTNKAGSRVTQSMKGDIKALFHDEANGGASNRVFLDIYRKDAIADIRIAECELKATKKRRWAKVNVNNQLVNLGTAQYVLDIAESKFPEDAGKNKLTRKIGLCDVDLAKEGVQAGVPEMQEGDYTRFRRQVD